MTVHIETCPQPTSILRTIRTLDLQCGLVLSPSTPVETYFAQRTVCARHVRRTRFWWPILPGTSAPKG